MRTVETTVYKYEELSDEAKEKARGWYRDCLDYEWWDSVYDDAKQIGEILGIYIDRINFCGFSSQGDGACYTGSYSYNKGWKKLLKKYAPLDEELVRIGTSLQMAQKHIGWTGTARITTSGMYSHSGSMLIDDEYCREYWGPIKEALRDFADWIYKRLEDEWNWLTSDEVVEESITANEYEFNEDGSVY